jgi:hypothetical protein
VAETEIEVAVAILAGAETVTETAAEVDVEKLASPEYIALMECEPTLSAASTKVVVPDEFRVPAPTCVAPSVKVTTPVGAADPDFGATVAVKVTAWPEVSCVEGADSEVVVATLVVAETVIVTAADVDSEKPASPEYAAVIEYVPTARPEVWKVATPDEFKVPVPI